MRIAIYARVSTEDRGQDPENQLRELRAWCANSGHVIAGEYVEHVSGRKGAAPTLLQLLKSVQVIGRICLTVVFNPNFGGCRGAIGSLHI